MAFLRLYSLLGVRCSDNCRQASLTRLIARITLILMNGRGNHKYTLERFSEVHRSFIKNQAYGVNMKDKRAFVVLSPVMREVGRTNAGF